MGRAARALHVFASDARGRRMRIGGLERWLPRAAPATARGVVSVALVSDARMRALNRRYRGKNRATDVLSFPCEGGSRRGRASPLAVAFLGDVVISRGVAARQAREMGHSLTAELRVLALHGLLHLLGYDHEHDRGQMRKLEQRLLRNAGMRDGLIGRARR
jgi:probable rRNA maturation factor